MKTRMSYATAVFTLAVTIMLVTMGPQEAFADHQKRSVVGSWTILGTPDFGEPFQGLGTIQRGGTVVTSDPIFGGGHGVWRRIGPRRYEVRFLTLVPPNDPFFAPNVVIDVQAVVRLNRKGKKASGPFVTTFTDPNGNLLATSTGQVILARITL